MNVWDDEYWLTCYGFDNFKISSYGRLWDNVYDEEIPQRFLRKEGVMDAKFSDPPNVFQGAVWRMMHATFFRSGWGIGVDVEYRDGDPTNLNHLNLLFSKDGIPHLYRLNEELGTWARRRGTHARRVQVVETGQEFNSVPEMVELLNLDRNAVYMTLRGAQKSHHGMHFIYLT